MRIPMTNAKLSNFALSYTMVVTVLLVLGFYAAGRAGIIPTELKHTAGHPSFATEMTYYDIPRMTVAMSSGGGGAHLRLDISLEVANKDRDVVEGYQPRITDKLNKYISTLRPDQLERPNAMPWLREELLKQINSVGSPVPIHDLMFRQFVIM